VAFLAMIHFPQGKGPLEQSRRYSSARQAAVIGEPF